MRRRTCLRKPRVSRRRYAYTAGPHPGADADAGAGVGADELAGSDVNPSTNTSVDVDVYTYLAEIISGMYWLLIYKHKYEYVRLMPSKKPNS